MLEATVGIMRGQAEARGLVTVLKVDDNLPTWVRGDPVRLRQVLLNFLSNAVKFTDQGAVKTHVALEEGATGRLSSAISKQASAQASALSYSAVLSRSQIAASPKSILCIHHWEIEVPELERLRLLESE